MANITPNMKNGKLVSFRFRCCLGRQENGKQLFKSTTWNIPEGLAPSKAERAAAKAADEWEKQAKAEYEKDLQDPDRVKAREIDRLNTDFAGFIRDIWFPLCVCDGEHKRTTVEFYRNITNKIAEYFEGTILQKISPVDIKRYLIYISPSRLTSYAPLFAKS